MPATLSLPTTATSAVTPSRVMVIMDTMAVVGKKTYSAARRAVDFAVPTEISLNEWMPNVLGTAVFAVSVNAAT